MGAVTVHPDEIVARLDALDVDVRDGASTSAYTDLGTSVNLNAVAIGMGLDDVVYDPEAFPGIVYEPEAYDGTVAVVFGNGTLFVDSAASVGVHDVVDEVTAQLAELGLVPEPTPGGEFSLTPTEVPVPPEYAEYGTEPAGGDPATDGTDQASVGAVESASEPAADATEACTECGHGLSGEENFCPECGAEVVPSCPSCGDELSGGENFCPECGTDLAAD